MPPAATVPPGPNGEISLEEFKRQANELHTLAQSRGLQKAFPFNIMRAETWPNGAPKDFVTMSIEQVPPHRRQDVLDAVVWSLSQ